MATMRSSIDSSLPRYEPLADNIDNTQPGGLSGLLHGLGAKKRQREGTVDETFEKNRTKCNRRKAATKVPDWVAERARTRCSHPGCDLKGHAGADGKLRCIKNHGGKAKPRKSDKVPRPPPPRPPSGFCGVTAHKKRWKARIRYDGKQHHLGTSDTKQEAALAHDRDARLKGCTFQCTLNYGSTAASSGAS
jgi:hypothetical protein